MREHASPLRRGGAQVLVDAARMWTADFFALPELRLASASGAGHGSGRRGRDRTPRYHRGRRGESGDHRVPEHLRRHSRESGAGRRDPRGSRCRPAQQRNTGTGQRIRTALRRVGLRGAEDRTTAAGSQRLRQFCTDREKSGPLIVDLYRTGRRSAAGSRPVDRWFYQMPAGTRESFPGPDGRERGRPAGALPDLPGAKGRIRGGRVTG